MIRALATFAFVALASLPALTPLRAQDRPPVRILVGFPPGGSADVVARAIGDAMRDDLGAVIVENKPGAAGRLAISVLAASSASKIAPTSAISPNTPSKVSLGGLTERHAAGAT